MDGDRTHDQTPTADDDLVPETSDESFPASDPPTFTRAASTPVDRDGDAIAQSTSERAADRLEDEAAPEIDVPDDERRTQSPS